MSRKPSSSTIGPRTPESVGERCGPGEGQADGHFSPHRLKFRPRMGLAFARATASLLNPFRVGLAQAVLRTYALPARPHFRSSFPANDLRRQRVRCAKGGAPPGRCAKGCTSTPEGVKSLVFACSPCYIGRMPNVVYLPGLLGSELGYARLFPFPPQNVWLDSFQLATGGDAALSQLAPDGKAPVLSPRAAKCFPRGSWPLHTRLSACSWPCKVGTCSSCPMTGASPVRSRLQTSYGRPSNVSSQINLSTLSLTRKAGLWPGLCGS